MQETTGAKIGQNGIHLLSAEQLTPELLDKRELIAIKATGCEKTNYIHASTGSINTAVGIAA